MKTILKGYICQPIAVCEVKLNYFHIYVHSRYQKEQLIKSCISFLFGRVCRMYSYLGECVQPMHPMVFIWQLNLALHIRVDLSDGRCTLVPEGGDEGADEELPYVDVAQGLDQSPEGPKANLASKGKPRIINPDFWNWAITFAMIVHLSFRSWIETLDAWSLGTYTLSLVCYVDSCYAIGPVQVEWCSSLARIGPYVGIIRSF
jgi:hypothetical protein